MLILNFDSLSLLPCLCKYLLLSVCFMVCLVAVLCCTRFVCDRSTQVRCPCLCCFGFIQSQQQQSSIFIILVITFLCQRFFDFCDMAYLRSIKRFKPPNYLFHE